MNLAANLKWIDVAAALPDDETLVLLAVNDDDVCPGFHLAGAWHYYDAMPITVERVTHWMAMPAAPAVAGQEAAKQSNGHNSQDPDCSCPSGSGSLRWPCLIHPPEILAMLTSPRGAA